ncbi:MAG TPA: hypothetical protein VFM33_06130, partial [Aquabacterium sp.]|nr:hypothetical protein [Aquabacterium sp.]
SNALMAMTLVISVVGVALPMGPWAAYFRLQALPAAYFPFLAAVLTGYVVLAQMMKRFYVRRFGWQ